MTAAALRLQIYQFRTNYAAIFAEYSAFSQQNFAPVRAKIAAAAFFAKAPAAKAQLFVGIEEFIFSLLYAKIKYRNSFSGGCR